VTKCSCNDASEHLDVLSFVGIDAEQLA